MSSGLKGVTATSVANGADTDRRESDDVDRAIAPAAFAAEKGDWAVKKLPSSLRVLRRQGAAKHKRR